MLKVHVPHDQCVMFQNYVWVKDPIAERISINFNVRAYEKFIGNGFRFYVANAI